VTDKIVYVRGDHRVVISNHFCSDKNVRAYDTVFNDTDNSIISLLNLMFSKDITVILTPLYKQQEDVDCGAFSVAVATPLLHTQSLL